MWEGRPFERTFTDFVIVPNKFWSGSTNGLADNTSWDVAVFEIKGKPDVMKQFVTSRNEYQGFADENMVAIVAGNVATDMAVPTNAKYWIHSLRGHTVTVSSITFEYLQQTPLEPVHGERYAVIRKAGTYLSPCYCKGASAFKLDSVRTGGWNNGQYILRCVLDFYDENGGVISHPSGYSNYVGGNTYSIPDGAAQMVFRTNASYGGIGSSRLILVFE